MTARSASRRGTRMRFVEQAVFLDGRQGDRDRRLETEEGPSYPCSAPCGLLRAVVPSYAWNASFGSSTAMLKLQPPTSRSFGRCLLRTG
jgi:hypothetical protein